MAVPPLGCSKKWDRLGRTGSRPNGLRTGRHEISVDCPFRGIRAADIDPGLQRVANDDRRHVHEHRQVHVAQFDDVEERLLFARLGDDLALIGAVDRDCRGTQVRAAGEGRYRCEERH
jgi:hypothetical protein